jgi:response regulator of citrate/malate metabolism
MTLAERQLIDSAFSAVKPWNSIDAMSLKHVSSEEQALIDKCCNCQYPYCFNCIQKKSSTVPKYMRFVELITTKLSAKEICEELNISRASYFNYKKRLTRSQVL